MAGPVTFDELSSYMSGDKEPWLSNRWRVLNFPTMGGATLSHLVCESMDLPIPQFDVRTKHYGAWSLHFVGGSNVDGFSMQLYVDDAWRSVKYITAWQSCMQNPDTGGFYLPSYYMRDLQIGLYNHKGESILTSTVQDVFPISMSEPALTANSDKLAITVQFKTWWNTLKWS